MTSTRHNNILFTIKNNLGVITLNRPGALNALNDDMFLALRKQLIEWKNDSTIKAVLIRSNSEKAFCAGGDIRAIYENKHHSSKIVGEYFHLEYEINKIIYHFPKPYIALIHGITMGGGVGMSIHGSNCVAADNVKWAMPETMIGFFPDVGVSYYFSRLPHHIGTYLALTGNPIDAQTALQLKLIKNIVPLNVFDELEKKLCEADFSSKDFDAVTKIINSFSKSSEKQNTIFSEEIIKKIENTFCFGNVESVFDALKKDKSEWAAETLQQLLQRSPTSLKVTLKQLHLAKHKTFDEVIDMDIHAALVMLENHDFFEGVRAAIIDKDKKPKWKPAQLSDVHDKIIAHYF